MRGGLPTLTEDQALIEKVKLRDQDAILALHQRYADLVYSVAYRVLGDTATAEECVQDTFMKVWQSTLLFDPQRGSFIGWLISVARHLAIDRLRQSGRHRKMVDERSLDDAESGEGRLALATLPDDWQDRERARHLRLAIQDLPADQRLVIELSYFGGLSQAEIAEELKIPLGTVKTRMRLGLHKLRDAWLRE